ncbi:hypothetical protein WA158_004875 [Blastocystis sp. Blastoise]
MNTSTNSEKLTSKHLSFISKHERMNARFQRYMEDRMTLIPSLGNDDDVVFAGIFDGHGGDSVSEYVSKNMHEIFTNVYKSGELPSIEKCLEVSFYIADMQVKQLEKPTEGSTAVVSILKKTDHGLELDIANCGDARAVLCSDGKAIRLSYDHKATDDMEQRRIEDAGGFILRNRVCGILAVSRSFGDYAYDDCVISRPYTHHQLIQNEDEFLVLSSDGIFDVMTDQEVVDCVQENIQNGNKETCAEQVIAKAIENGASDNLSVIVLGFK